MAYITKSEMDSLQEAIDFISTNADGADDYSSYEDLNNKLRSIWQKAIKDNVRRKMRKKLNNLNKPIL